MSKEESGKSTNKQPTKRSKREIALENLKKASGFDKNPQNINRSGAPKGKWRKTLLRDLMAMPLEESDQTQFEGLKKLFPTYFRDTEEKNFQFFMELKQLSLIFSKQDQVAQSAMKEIRDRIDGKAAQTITQETTHKVDPEIASMSWLDMFSREDEKPAPKKRVTKPKAATKPKAKK